MLLADEATGNLDPANKQRILDILFRYVDKQQATLLAVTHDYELLDRFDQVIDLKTMLTLTPNTSHPRASSDAPREMTAQEPQEEMA